MTESKPHNCTCEYPDLRLRNGSGHDPSCPVHVEWLAQCAPAPSMEQPVATEGVRIGMLSVTDLVEMTDRDFKVIDGLIEAIRQVRAQIPEAGSHLLRCLVVTNDSVGYFPGDEPRLEMFRHMESK